MKTRGILQARIWQALGRRSPIVLAAAGLALVLPGTGLAVGDTARVADSADDLAFLPFTPAGADPRLAARVAAVVGEEGLRFTPAVKARPAGTAGRTVNVAVRVDSRLVASLARPGVRVAAAGPAAAKRAIPVTASRYDLGIARGYQSFAKPAPPASTFGGDIRDIAMPDLSTYAAAPDKPSRFRSRIALENGPAPAARPMADGAQLDVQTSYRLGRNLDVTAGVRLSQDRDRLAPLTDGKEDDQAVYVGTQIRF